MTSTTFYERRRQDLSLGINNRRAANRRSRHMPYSHDRRRLASQIRQYERESLKIPIRLQMGEETISGYTHNIGSGGLQVFCDPILRPGISVTLQFSFGETVCFLNIPGQTVFCRSIRKDNSVSHLLGIKFSTAYEWEKKILTAVIRALRQKSSATEKLFLTIQVAIDAMSSSNTDSAGPAAIKADQRLHQDHSDDYCDRRFASRITAHLSARVELKDLLGDETSEFPCSTLNLSAGGAALTFKMMVSTPMNADLFVFFSTSEKPVKVSGSIVWNHTTILDPLTKETRFKYGMQFTEVEEQTQNELGQFIGQHLLSKDRLCERRVKTSIVSELIHFKNQYGKTIAGFYDYSSGRDAMDNPLVIIPPAYGETKRENLSLSYSLAKNGFNVIRYDNTDHVGESDGDIFDTTLTKMTSDLLSALDYAGQMGCGKICVVASSLAARAAIRAASLDFRVGLLICIIPVVNLQYTLREVYKEDMIGTCMDGRKWDATNVLGFEVNGSFLDIAIRDRFHDFQSTLDDLRRINIPTMFVVADNDPWIDLEEVKSAFKAISTPQKEICVISGASHRLDENPTSIKTVQTQVVKHCLKYMRKLETSRIESPNIREIAIQSRIEGERCANFKKLNSHEERHFWSEYLSKFKYIVNIHDYWKLLGSIQDFLGEPRKGEIWLDAGCGNGSFGAYLLVNTMYKNRDALLRNSFPLFHYVGLDFVEAALEEARSAHQNLQLEFIERMGQRNLIGQSYILCDLNDPLNFMDNSFDKICCNMVVSYLQNPLFTLKELIRVLKPDGKIVVTSLKPHADLTQVYRNFIGVAESEEELSEARRLLNNSGAIKRKEADGYYKFFSEKELTMAVTMAGAGRMKAYRALTNQAVVIVAEKD